MIGLERIKQHGSDFIKLLQEYWSVSVRMMRPAGLGSSGRRFALVGVLFEEAAGIGSL